MTGVIMNAYKDGGRACESVCRRYGCGMVEKATYGLFVCGEDISVLIVVGDFNAGVVMGNDNVCV